MRVTERDIRLLRDLSLSHVLSRDQILALGYFHSLTRINARLKLLKDLELLRVLDTPFFAQSLYAVLPKASEIVGERLAPLTAARTGSPRFLQHALSVTNTRIALLGKGADRWLFEQQASVSFSFQGRTYEVRPDGMAIENGIPLPVEVDLGHMGAPKFTKKLKAYDAFVRSGEAERSWRTASFSLLVITTGPERAKRLSGLLPNAAFATLVKTFSQLQIPSVGGWS
jgi:hypothetical protein